MQILKELKVAPCPRTKAKTCECEEVKTISEAEGFVSAKCELEHSDTVKGMIALMQPTKGGPTLIKGRIIGLTPGEHGFHIHEFGDFQTDVNLQEHIIIQMMLTMAIWIKVTWGI